MTRRMIITANPGPLPPGMGDPTPAPIIPLPGPTIPLHASARTDWHVTYQHSNGLWMCDAERGSILATYHLTQAEAIGCAITHARDAASSVVVHRRDGRISRVWSYDNAHRGPQ